MSEYTRDEMMTVAAARLLRDGQVCFVGIGLPSAACNLARLTHAPNLVLIYESGTIGTRPTVLPLSIGDGELAETATCVIPLPDIFSDYLQAGRIDIGFLGAAQIDKFGNLNSTVIGPLRKAEDAPARRGRRDGDRGARARGLHRHEGLAAQLREEDRFPDQRRPFRRPRGEAARGGKRPRRPRHRRRHLETARGNRRIRTFRRLSRNSGRGSAAAIGWPLAVLPELETCAPPTAPELEALRALETRTAAAHREPVRLPL